MTALREGHCKTHGKTMVYTGSNDGTCVTCQRALAASLQTVPRSIVCRDEPMTQSMWNKVGPDERRRLKAKHRAAIQRELEATESTLIPHPASPPVPKEYDPATAGGMKIVMTRQVRRAFQRRWGLAVHQRDKVCRVSGARLVTDACHIKPVAACTNIDEARDLNNGVVLRSDLHRLFDRGYFTWDALGWIVYAEGFVLTKQVPHVRWKGVFTPEQHRYITWHRENRFNPNVMQEKRNVHTHSGLGSE